MPTRSRTVLRAPSAATTYSAATTDRSPVARSRTVVSTPEASCRRATTSVEKRRSVRPSAWIRRSSTGSTWSCGLMTGPVGLTAAACSGVGKPSGATRRSVEASDGRIDIIGTASRLNARISSSTPRPRKISIERVLTPDARGWIEVPGWRSTSVERMPLRARIRAVTRPAGPAPTMRTEVLVRRVMACSLRCSISSDSVYSDAQSVR